MIAIAIGVAAGWLWLGPQEAGTKPATGANPPPAAPAPKPATPGLGVQFDSNGWPVVAGDPGPAPAAESKPAKVDRSEKGHASAPGKPLASPQPAANGAEPFPRPAGIAAGPAPLPPPARPFGAAAPALASGMQLGSPLLDVYQAVGAPGAFRQLGGQVVWWRVTTYGHQGEAIGVREVTHTADCAFAERDRLEHQDGRLYGRVGPLAFAERNGLPLPMALEDGQQELMLFGLLLRTPWLFADASAFAVLTRSVEDHGGDRLVRLTLERRPPPALDVLGPEAEPVVRDRFELLLEPSGVPREFVHRFASSRQTRRVLLEDWREVSGVKLPHRRVYVDEGGRPTTALEILRIEGQRVSERDFRLH